MATQFKEIIMQLNKAENTATTSTKLQDQFLRMAEIEGRLPGDATVTLIDAFLQNLTNLLIKTQTGANDVRSRAVKILNLYLTQDDSIKGRFNPSR